LVPPIATGSSRGNSFSKPSPSIAGAPSASTTSGASISSTSAMRCANSSSDFTYAARAPGAPRLTSSSAAPISRCDRHFWWNAGAASAYIAVACIALMPSEKTA
jgi:hypothetical protein